MTRTACFDRTSAVVLAARAGGRGRWCRVLNLAVPAGLAPATSRPTSCRSSASISASPSSRSRVDLVWGYRGILSLGHGAFFALGGYAMGMYLMRQIGTARRLRPSGPARLHGLPELEGAALVLARLRPVLVRRPDGACWCPGLLAFVFGWFAFRSRVTGVYLSIITQAMTFALMLAFFRNDMGFGGNNGLTDFKDILGFPLQAPATRAGAVRRLGASRSRRGYRRSAASSSPRRFGKVLVAIRDAESRTRFLGYRVEQLQARWSSPSRPCWPASPARSTCRRSASSTRASSRRRTPSRW